MHRAESRQGEQKADTQSTQKAEKAECRYKERRRQIHRVESRYTE